MLTRTAALPSERVEAQLAVPELSIVIPAYNEAGRIGPSLDQLLAYLGGVPFTWEVIVVDDGSRDDTAAVVSARRAIRLHKLPENRGKGAALRAGVAISLGRRVLVMDADLSARLADLERLSAALEAGATIAVGSRALATSEVPVPQSPLRVLLGRAGNLWIRALAVPGIRDTQCGFKLFDGDAARRLFALCREQRFGVDIEVLALARRLRYDVAEVGVHWEHQDGSKVGWRDYVDVLVRVPRIAWGVRTLRVS